VDEEVVPETSTSLGKSSEVQDLVITLATSAIKVVTNKIFELLLPLLSIIFGFIIWRGVMEHPDVFQLVGLGLYGAFVLVPTIIFRRK
jgi:hypothetical protein